MQLLGGLAVGFIIFAGFVGWRLTTGPISLAYLTPYFETALQAADRGFAVKLEDTVLTWSGATNTLEIRLQGARAIGRSGGIVAAVPELRVSLSGAALLRGQLAPRSISIQSPALNILRLPSGRLVVDLPGDQSKRAQANFAAVIFEQLMVKEDQGGPLSYLRTINIIEGDLTIEDQLTDLIWRAPAANIELERDGGMIRSRADLEFQVGRERAAFAVTGDFDIAREVLALDIGFANVNPTLFSQVIANSELAKILDAPMSGTVTANILPSGEIPSAEFVLSTEAGNIVMDQTVALSLPIANAALRGRFDQASATTTIEELSISFPKDKLVRLPAPISYGVPVKGLIMTGSFFADFNRLDIARLTIDMGGPEATVAGSIQETNGDLKFEANAVLNNMPLEKLADFWPSHMGVKPRDWILDNISAGEFSTATARLFGSWNPLTGFDISGVSGDIDMHGVAVEYLDGLPVARNAHGHAKYTEKRFEITVNGAESHGLRVAGGTINFTDLDKFDQFTEIDLVIEGPVEAGLSLIEHEPLGFVTAAGLTPGSIAGKGTTRLKMRFIAELALEFDQVQLEAISTLSDVTAEGLFFDLNARNGEFKLRVDTDDMQLDGVADVAGARTAMNWSMNFDEDAAVRSRQTIKAKLDDAQRAEIFKLSAAPFGAEFVTGIADVEAVLVRDSSDNGEFFAQFGLTDVALAVPQFGWAKPAGIEADARVTAKLSGTTLTGVPSFSVGGGGMQMQGSAEVSEGKLTRLEFANLAFGDTDLAGVLIPNDKGWDADFHGPRLDLSAWMESKRASTDNEIQAESEPGQALTVSVNVDNVRLGPAQVLENVSGALAYDGRLWQRMNLKAALESKKTLELTLTPLDGVRTLKVRSDDAGQVLRTFDLYDNMIGGTLVLDAVYEDAHPRKPLEGKAVVNNFRVIKAPLLTRVLSIAALTGILEALSGEGLAFSSLEVPFVDDDGVITVKNAKASGLSLGLTAAGAIDTNSQSVDLSGTVVPAYLINSVLGRLPVVGPVFTGGEEGGGIFAANYAVRGQIAEPTVTYNPLSALAPGFLRNLFGIFDQKPAEDASSPPTSSGKSEAVPEPSGADPG